MVKTGGGNKMDQQELSLRKVDVKLIFIHKIQLGIARKDAKNIKFEQNSWKIRPNFYWKKENIMN